MSGLRSWRSVVLCFALVAFTLQSYVTQTHIHLAAGTTTKIAAVSAKGSHTTPRDHYPSNEDPANCPLCQEILHAGHYVAPSAIAFFAPAQAIGIIPLLTAIPLPHQSAGYSWQSRAPPLA